MNNLRSLMSATLLALALAAPSVQAADESPWKFEFHGFVTGSMYYQDQAFGNGQGQGLLLVAPTNANRAPAIPAPPATTLPCGTGQLPTAALPCGPAVTSGKILSGDVRNSRFAFSMAGPKVFTDAQPRAYFEFDFFGQNGAGAFGTEQEMPRLRVGYVELKMGGTNVQVGQQNQLVVQQIPGSISHIANPMTYGAGTIGWRTPGVRVTQLVPMGDAKLTFAAELVKNKWSREAQNQGTGNATTPSLIGEGEASGLPMVQAMGRVDGKAGDLAYTAYLVGVYHQVDLAGFGGSLRPTVGAAFTPIVTDMKLTGYVGELGGKVTYAPVSLMFNVYTGKATGGMLGSLVTFGDIKDMGYWVNLSGNFTKELSLGLLYGANSPDKADMRKWAGNTTRLSNTTMGGMLKYQDGGYALAVEAYQMTTTYSATATTTYDSSGLQVIATAGYFF